MPAASPDQGPRLSSDRPLVIGCGALAVELVALTRRAGLPEVDLTCLPASLHNRPERIPGAVRARIRKAREAGREQVFVAYADCGTGGLLDRVLEDEGVARLEGAHCYEVYAGRAAFAAMADEEPGTFYLTDFLVRNFERLVVRGLGLDRHPELLPIYFGNYRRLLYLAQTEDPALDRGAEAAAARLGLIYERHFTGLGELAVAMQRPAGERDSQTSLDGRAERNPPSDPLGEPVERPGMRGRHGTRSVAVFSRRSSSRRSEVVSVRHGLTAGAAQSIRATPAARRSAPEASPARAASAASAARQVG